MAIVIVNDATHSGISSLPRGQMAAGYTTGSGGVPWTQADWNAHPGAVRICQNVSASDHTADVLDVESGAATVADCPGWAKAALANYHSGARPGQRSPAIYLNLFNVTPVVNALSAAGVTGIGLWLANWNNNEPSDAAQVAAGSGPYPVIGVQFHNAGNYDTSCFSATWLNAVSGKAPTPPPAPASFQITAVPPGQWKAGTALLAVGFGSDGTPWETLTGDGKSWTAPVAVGSALPPVATSSAVAYSVLTPLPGWWKEGAALTVTGIGLDGGTWRAATSNGSAWTGPVLVAPAPPPPPPPPTGYQVTVPPPGTWQAGSQGMFTGTDTNSVGVALTTNDGKTWS